MLLVDFIFLFLLFMYNLSFDGQFSGRIFYSCLKPYPIIFTCAILKVLLNRLLASRQMNFPRTTPEHLGRRTWIPLSVKSRLQPRQAEVRVLHHRDSYGLLMYGGFLRTGSGRLLSAKKNYPESISPVHLQGSIPVNQTITLYYTC